MQNEKYSCGNDPQPEKNIELPVRITEESGDEKMEYDDLSDIPHEQKMEILNGLAIIASKQFLGYFLAFGLKSHIEQMIVEENSGQEYILSFRTLPEHMKKRPLEQDEQPDMAKLLEEKEREIERLKEQVNDLKMDAAAHEYNEAERIKFQPEYEREICVRFAEYIGGLEMKMYKDGWCEPGGSNGFYYSTNDLYTKFLGEHTANH